jgi:hypothetical protein
MILFSSIRFVDSLCIDWYKNSVIDHFRPNEDAEVTHPQRPRSASRVTLPLQYYEAAQTRS